MINRYAKGMRNQSKCRAWYESLGYQVEMVRYSKWLKNKDFWGLWDLICVSSGQIHFVQVKTNQKPSKAWFTEAANWKCPESAVKLAVVYEDGQRGCIPAKSIIVPNWSCALKETKLAYQ